MLMLFWLLDITVINTLILAKVTANPGSYTAT